MIIFTILYGKEYVDIFGFLKRFLPSSSRRKILKEKKNPIKYRAQVGYSENN